jgi:hypothetical protein
MKVEYLLDGIHSSVTRRWNLQVFTAFTRCLFALSFIPPSIPKILHRPFTILPDSNPVGHYFNALYQTGFYYEFIGWAQITAALPLLIPTTAHIGSLMFLPIILNIAVLTLSVGFKGTWLITLLMSFAAAWLVAWEYHRLKPLLFSRRERSTRRFKFELAAIPVIFALGGMVVASLSSTVRLGNFSSYFRIGLLLSASGLVFGVTVALHYRFMPVGKLDNRGSEIQSSEIL